MFDICSEIAKSSKKVEVEYFDGKQIQEKGFGLIHAVGRGASHEPYLVYMNYKGNPDSA